MNSHDSISIAVLPFEDLSDRKDTLIFCKSFCMDLITELSYFRQFTIIAWQSARLILTQQQIDNKKLKDWNIDYFIQGSFRDTRNCLRVNAQLFHAETNRLVWANRFQGHLDELIDIQDCLLREIVCALQLQVNEDLLSRKRVRQKVKLRAYEYWLYGVDAVKKGTLEADLDARKYFQKAIDAEPDYSLAYSGMSLTYFNEWSCQLWDRWELSRNGAFEWAKKAIEIDEDNYIAALIIGRIFLYQGSYESAEYYLRRSLWLNSNDPESLILIASCFTYLGFGEEARELYQKAIRLNPVGAGDYHSIGAFVHFELGEYEEAKRLAWQSVVLGFLDADAFFAATFHYLGDDDQMRQHWARFLTLFKKKIKQGEDASAEEAILWMKKINPYRYSSHMEPFWAFISDTTLDSVECSPVPEYKENTKTCVFHKEGDLWKYDYGGITGLLPEVKGFHDIHTLITSPGKEVHCSDLMKSVLIQYGEPVADEQARNEYLKKLNLIRAGLAEAEEKNDHERSEELQKQYDELIKLLSKTFDSRGRARKENDTADKTRSAVTWRIRSAISRIEKANPALGRHFSNTIKTGTYCQYSPETPIVWHI